MFKADTFQDLKTLPRSHMESKTNNALKIYDLRVPDSHTTSIICPKSLLTSVMLV